MQTYLTDLDTAIPSICAVGLASSTVHQWVLTVEGLRDSDVPIADARFGEDAYFSACIPFVKGTPNGFAVGTVSYTGAGGVHVVGAFPAVVVWRAGEPDDGYGSGIS